MGDLEVEYDSDQDVSEHHSKLIEAVAQLDNGQRVKKAERSEPTFEVSEFHLVKSGVTDKDAVRVRDLAKSLGLKGYQSVITKKFQSAQKKTKVLPKPLEKPAAERVKRTIGFENTKKELEKWNAIIAKNRTADRLFFPLNTPKKQLKNTPTTEFLKRFRLQSDLQKKLEEVDPTPQEPEEIEEKNKYQMTLEEVMMKRKEAAQLRAQQSYKEAKARRQRKIKSKKFHRIERKSKVKEQLKEFEELQKTNPSEALVKLEQLDKSRAEERMSLRHKNTGQWAKNKQIRAKYNKETRQVLAEQLAISRELTQKLKRTDDSDDENEENEAPLVLPNSNKDNPWVNNVKTESEINEFIKNCRNYWDEKNKKSEEKKIMESKAEQQNSDKPSKANDIADNVYDNVDDTVVPIKQITEPVTTKKMNKNANTRCAIISDKIVSKNKMVKLREKKENGAIKKDACATSMWQVEELQCNKKMDFKLVEQLNIDDMFDCMEEKLQHKVNLKLQKMKKKLNTMDKVKKQKKENKKNENYSPNLEFKESRQKPILDLPLDETTSKEILHRGTNPTGSEMVANMEQKQTDGKSNGYEEEIDPQKYLNVKPKYLKTELPDLDVGGDDVMDNSEQEEETHKIMSEAFADDDVVEEFRKEKRDEIEKSQPESIDLRLPGWGSWAGANIKMSKVNRKKRKFILKFPKDAPRKDENRGDVIIFEGVNEKLKKHLVSELPYPFTTVKDFEASIRAPLGRTFVPEKAHARLIQPTVSTKLGKVIEPMTEDMLVKKQSVLKRSVDDNMKNAAKNNKKKRK